MLKKWVFLYPKDFNLDIYAQCVEIAICIKSALYKTALGRGNAEKVEFILKRVNLEAYFDEIVTSEDVKDKPDGGRKAGRSFAKRRHKRIGNSR